VFDVEVVLGLAHYEPKIPHFFNRPNCCIMLKKYISAWRIYIY
jgi:hypothetical protein